MHVKEYNAAVMGRVCRRGKYHIPMSTCRASERWTDNTLSKRFIPGPTHEHGLRLGLQLQPWCGMTSRMTQHVGGDPPSWASGRLHLHPRLPPGHCLGFLVPPDPQQVLASKLPDSLVPTVAPWLRLSCGPTEEAWPRERPHGHCDSSLCYPSCRPIPGAPRAVPPQHHRSWSCPLSTEQGEGR